MPDEIGYVVLFVVGCLAGVLNVIAGGGSFLTLPILIFLGLPATVANGANRVGIPLQAFQKMLTSPMVTVRLASLRDFTQTNRRCPRAPPCPMWQPRGLASSSQARTGDLAGREWNSSSWPQRPSQGSTWSEAMRSRCSACW